MMVFDLKCGAGHVFEAWFRNSSAYETQRESKIIVCPTCGSVEISKAPMAPNIATGAKVPECPALNPEQPAPNSEQSAPATHAMDQLANFRKNLTAALAQVRSHVEANFDYVGERFPEEARRIHYGEVDPHPIYGEASPEDSRALKEEGIEFVTMPFLPKHDA